MILFLAIVLVVLWWYAKHPYRITSSQMVEAIERTLAKEMQEEEWTKLMRTQIRRDRYLDSLRLRLDDVPRRTATKEDGALYAPDQMQKVAGLLGELKKRRSYDL